MFFMDGGGITVLAAYIITFLHAYNANCRSLRQYLYMGRRCWAVVRCVGRDGIARPSDQAQEVVWRRRGDFSVRAPGPAAHR